jgi:hypothetical protein
MIQEKAEPSACEAVEVKGSWPASIGSGANLRIGREVFGRASGMRVSEFTVRSIGCARSPNKSPEPTRSSTLSFRQPCPTSNVTGRVAHL